MSEQTKFIIISGIDGSGKTTIINELKKALDGKGFSTQYIWLRFNHYTVKVLNAFARILKLSVPQNINNTTVWQHRFYLSPAFCSIYIACSFFDNWLARLKTLNLKADYIICDRWIADTLVDLGAECRRMDILESKWYDRFMKLVPVNSVQFVINRNLEDVLVSREENRRNPDFSARYELYAGLITKKEMIAVDNNDTIAQSVEIIMTQLNDERRNAKVCLTSSAGGHMQELNLAIRDFCFKEQYWITYSSPHIKQLMADKKHHFVKNISSTNPFGWLINAVQSFWYLCKERPDLIISTGAGVSLPTIAFGKLFFKCRVIYIVSAADVSEPSRTPVRAYPFCDLFLIQWQDLQELFPKAQYIGLL